jgi:murein DD-endopeptidase MepM/ murein hydrolase activator NlpD
MKRLVKIIIVLLVLNGLVFAAIPLIKVKNAAAQQGPDPLTFYCQLEEDYINYSIINWQEAIAEFAAALDAGGSDGDGGPPPLPNPGALAWPVSNPVIGQPFCQRCSGGWHGGIDLNFGNAEGTPIYAAADGTVTRADYLCCDPDPCNNPSSCMGHLGNYVSIQHEIQGKTYTTDYFHLSSVSVTLGQEVTQGQVIGTMGNTCTCSVHLHFALREKSTYTNPCLFLPDAGTGSQCLAGIGCKQEPGTCPGP